jgi:hypothetical protein
MSLATLSRKTKTTAPRFRKEKCFVLNMTGRNSYGTGLGTGLCAHPGVGTASQGSCKKCCSANSQVSESCRNSCGKCWHKGLSQPAPQMSYRNYLNRKSNGAYRPGGGQQCSIDLSACILRSVWKQTPSFSAGDIIQEKKSIALRCVLPQLIDPSSGKVTTKSHACAALKNCCCGSTLGKNGGRSYCLKVGNTLNRINNPVCGVTKDLGKFRTASEQIARVRSGGSINTNFTYKTCANGWSLIRPVNKYCNK